jgi:hypothetical protein
MTLRFGECTRYVRKRNEHPVDDLIWCNGAILHPSEASVVIDVDKGAAWLSKGQPEVR